jgi:hypothetical protein
MEPTTTWIGCKPRSEPNSTLTPTAPVVPLRAVAYSPHPGEHRADGNVAAAAAASECADRERDRDAAAKYPDQQVESREQSAQAARKRNMSKGVGGEDLVAQDHEVSDQSSRQRDAAARHECVAHEVEREHLLHQA